MQLRDYQIKAIEQLRHSLSTGHRMPMLKMNTGAGKTVVAGEIIKSANHKGKRVAFIVDRVTLVDQASAHFDAIGLDHGVIQADHWRTNYGKRIQVISAQTLVRRKPWEFDLGIIDEAHCMYKGVLELAQEWNRIPFIGLSATPFTKGLGKYYDDLVDPISIQELIDLGHLVDADAYGPSKPDMKGVKVTAGDFNQKEAAKRADQEGLIANIVETWKKLASDRQTICFATNVEHSKHIVERFRAVGVNAQHIDAYTDSTSRRQHISDFKAGKVKLLSSVGVLTTGFDAPNAEVAILARPTKSLSLHIQMIGRILRPFPGKIRGLILDHAGNIERLGFHTDPTPNYLDDGTHQISEAEEMMIQERLPHPCPKCHAMIPAGVHICPSCGSAYQRPNKTVEQEGQLEKIKKKENREVSWDEKFRFIAGLRWQQEQYGKKPGWVAHMYRERFGVWPNDPRVNNAPAIKPDQETLNYIKHINIKRAKSRQRNAS